MKLIEFKLSDKKNGRIALLTIPVSRIACIESLVGSENCYCAVNGIEVRCSYWDLLKMLEEDDYSNKEILRPT